MAERAIVDHEPVGHVQPRARATAPARRPCRRTRRSHRRRAWTHMDGLYRVAYDLGVRRALLILASTLAASAGVAGADDSKLAKEDVPLQPKANLRGKNKLCCGYPLVDDNGWALRFYWLALEADYQDPRTSTAPKSGRGSRGARQHLGRALHRRRLLLRARPRAVRVVAAPGGLGPDDGRPRRELQGRLPATATAPASSSSTSRSTRSAAAPASDR